MDKQFDYWLTVSWFKRMYNIQLKTLKARGVVSRSNAYGHLEFRVDDAVNKCADLISKRLNTSSDQAREYIAADNRKAFEDLRKLELANSLQAGEAVAVADLRTGIGNAIRAMTDRLEAIPTKVRMGVSDVPPAHMVKINAAIIHKRNEAAGHRRDYNGE